MRKQKTERGSPGPLCQTPRLRQSLLIHDPSENFVGLKNLHLAIGIVRLNGDRRADLLRRNFKGNVLEQDGCEGRVVRWRVQHECDATTKACEHPDKADAPAPSKEPDESIGI